MRMYWCVCVCANPWGNNWVLYKMLSIRSAHSFRNNNTKIYSKEQVIATKYFFKIHFYFTLKEPIFYIYDKLIKIFFKVEFWAESSKIFRFIVFIWRLDMSSFKILQWKSKLITKKNRIMCIDFLQYIDFQRSLDM